MGERFNELTKWGGGFGRKDFLQVWWRTWDFDDRFFNLSFKRACSFYSMWLVCCLMSMGCMYVLVGMIALGGFLLYSVKVDSELHLEFPERGGYKRMFWQFAYPFLLLPYLVYREQRIHNITSGSWTIFGRPSLFEVDHYGDTFEKIPDEVPLGGVPYKVVVSDGLVVFVNNSGMSGGRIAMSRDPHDRYAAMWYLEYDKTYQAVPMSHVDKAYRWVKAVYGGSFEFKKDPV